MTDTVANALPVATTATTERKTPSKWKKRLRSAWQVDQTSIDGASYYMLQLYRTNLEVRLRSIDPASLASENERHIYESVEEILARPIQPSIVNRQTEWDETYKAERLICLLLSGVQLRHEIAARLQDLTGESPSEAEILTREYELLKRSLPDDPASKASDTLLRAFLLRVMEVLHWIAKKKYLARPVRKEATKRILIFVLVCFLLLVAPYIYLNFDFASPTSGMPMETTRIEEVSKIWSLFALWTAVSAGLLGAFFSRLISMQRHWATLTLDEVFLHREYSYTFLRAGVGMCGALIVYFFLRSGIVEGALFPVFSKVAIEFINVPEPDAAPAVRMAFVMPSKSLALLTFWCFLAGFSEALVPSILAGTEGKFADASSQPVKAGMA